MRFRSINPATLEVVGEWGAASVGEVVGVVGRGGRRFAEGVGEVEERCGRLRGWAGAIRGRGEALARVAVAEMGKPIGQARAEVERCAAGLEGVASLAPGWLGEDAREGGAGFRGVVYEGMGVVLGVMPWNFPYWQIVRFAAGAMAAGNVVVVKPAPNTVGCALALEGCAREAGIDEGLYATVLAGVEDIEAMVAHPAVAAVSLTGSVGAGRALAGVAAKYGKPAVLELGGSDAFVVLDDVADVEAVARKAAEGRCLNSGQSCICAKRFVVMAGVYERFREAFVGAMRGKRVGDPTREETEVGPMARGDLREGLARQLAGAVAGGGRALCGGGVREGRGYYFGPEVVELDAAGGPVWEEETFGPVGALVRAGDEGEAVRLANATRFGLGCSVWTGDAERGRRVARRVRAGNVFVNELVRSVPGLPFGGVGASGYGKELGAEGVRGFANAKVVWVGGG